MKVQSCPSCGARYRVERLEEGAVFLCGRCQAQVRVGAEAPPPRPFAVGPLVSGLLVLLGLLLYANPEFGFGRSRWPWELLLEDAVPATRVAVALWALAGAWAFVSALGVVPRSRSLLTLALAGVLALVCTGHGVAEPRVDLPLHALVGLVALGSGLFLVLDPATSPHGRTLAFAGGLLLVWWFVFNFDAATARPHLSGMLRDVGGLFGGEIDASEATGNLLPSWALVLGAVTGLLVGMGAGARGAAWTGVGLILVALLMPPTANLVHALGKDEPWSTAGGLAAEHGTAALISSGLALWLLASTAVSDLVRNRKETP